MEIFLKKSHSLMSGDSLTYLGLAPWGLLQELELACVESSNTGARPSHWRGPGQGPHDFGSTSGLAGSKSSLLSVAGRSASTSHPRPAEKGHEMHRCLPGGQRSQ